jgi:hypothetical protein
MPMQLVRWFWKRVGVLLNDATAMDVLPVFKAFLSIDEGGMSRDEILARKTATTRPSSNEKTCIEDLAQRQTVALLPHG